LINTESKLLPHPPTLPDFVEGKISQLVSQKGMTRESVVQEYMREFNAFGEQASRQFPNATAELVLTIRQQAAIGRVWQQLIQRPAAFDFDIMFLGHNGKRLSKGQKKPYCNGYVGIKENEAFIIRRMSGNGKYADLIPALTPLSIYHTQLGRFGQVGDLIVDDRSKFGQATPTGMDVFQLCKTFNIPILTIEDAMKNPSKKGSDNYSIATDWRCILGYVSGQPRIFTPGAKDKKDKIPVTDGSELQSGIITITDSTIKESPFQDTQGRMIMPGITGWTAPDFCIVEEGSYCAFLGTFDVNKDPQTQQDKGQMAIALVIPIFVSQSEGLEEK